jgi:Protein of unknown function (DUF3592)
MAAIRPYLALILALILGVMTYSAAKPVLAFVKVAKPAQAKVTGIHPCKERPPPDGSRSNLDGIAECADVTFKALSGREVVGVVRGWPGRATKGETLDILYDPERPERHGRDGILDLWWSPGLLGLCAALILVRGTVGLGRQYS